MATRPTTAPTTPAPSMCIEGGGAGARAGSHPAAVTVSPSAYPRNMRATLIGISLALAALGCTSHATQGSTGGSGTSGASSGGTTSTSGTSSSSSGGSSSTGGTTTTGGATTSGGSTSGGTTGGSTGGCQPSCDAGVCCGSSCADLGSDRTNCGRCGALCPGTSECFNGGCFDPVSGDPALCNVIPCPSGYGCFIGRICLPLACTGLGDGIWCAVPGFSQIGLCCGEACILPEYDHDHCGSCGNFCASAQFCNNGRCADFNGCVGAPPAAPCPLAPLQVGACCGGDCVDVTTDSANCASCGGVCPTGATCRGAVCLDSDGGFADCSAPGSCPAGSLCSGATCLPPDCTSLPDNSSCALGPQSFGTCCGGVCTDLTVDRANCLACGRACDAGDICVGGMDCFPGNAVPGLCDNPNNFEPCGLAGGGIGLCCPGSPPLCADLVNDPLNCGACTFRCESGQMCVQGICTGQGPTCPSTRFTSYCDADAGPTFVCCPGAPCADLESDPAHCGDCQHACGTGHPCVGGQCQ